MSDEKHEERGFTVIDRRGGQPEEEQEAPGSASEPAQRGGLPRVDFATFCLSLGTSALYHLGLVGDPDTGDRPAEPNLPVARQTIDTLEMLRDKTRGNLDDEEARMLDGLLYELHMHYLEAGKKPAPDPKPRE